MLPANRVLEARVAVPQEDYGNNIFLLGREVLIDQETLNETVFQRAFQGCFTILMQISCLDEAGNVIPFDGQVSLMNLQLVVREQPRR